MSASARFLQLLMGVALIAMPLSVPVEVRWCPVTVTVDSLGFTDLVQSCRVYVKSSRGVAQ
jgi:hypothetical protein